MIVNEAFDALAFLCIALTGLCVIMCGIYLFYKYILGVDLNLNY